MGGFVSITTSTATGGYGKILTDATFEHDTQASTGQTTGTWAIRFCGSRESCKVTDERWESLQEDVLEKDIFLASVDIGKEVGLAARFQGYVTDDPVVILLRRGKMYVHSLDFVEIVEWMVSGWEKEEPLEVPLEPGFFDKKTHRMLLMGVVVVMILVVWMMTATSEGSKRD